MTSSRFFFFHTAFCGMENVDFHWDSCKAFALVFAAACLIFGLTWMRKESFQLLHSSFSQRNWYHYAYFTIRMQEESEEQNRFHLSDQHEMWVRYVLPTLDFVIPVPSLKQEMCHLTAQWKYCGNDPGFESWAAAIYPKIKPLFWVQVALFKE